MNFFDDLANHNYHPQGIVFMRLPYFFTPADWTWRWNVQIFEWLCCLCPKYQMWRSWISLAILLPTITTHRASSSCGFSTYIHFLIGLDDGTWTNIGNYADFVPIINLWLMFCFCWAIWCFSQLLLLPLTSMVTEIDDDNCDLIVPLVKRQLDICDNCDGNWWIVITIVT